MDRDGFRSRIFLLLLIAAFLNLSACTSQEKKIEVTVIADFGPANRPEVQKKVAVLERSTVFEALRAAFPVATSGR
jgi:hypothetical protein